MGKTAKGLRHVKKMQERRAEKHRKAALYASLAGSGSGKKRGAGKGQKKSFRVRDPNCRNIGDILSHPETEESVLRLYRLGQYRGRYKGWARDNA